MREDSKTSDKLLIKQVMSGFEAEKKKKAARENLLQYRVQLGRDNYIGLVSTLTFTASIIDKFIDKVNSY